MLLQKLQASRPCSHSTETLKRTPKPTDTWTSQDRILPEWERHTAQHSAPEDATGFLSSHQKKQTKKKSTREPAQANYNIQKGQWTKLLADNNLDVRGTFYP